MKKHLAFFHNNYPAQFGSISEFLLREYDVEISFLTQHISKKPAPGVRYYNYEPVSTGHEEFPYFFSRYFEQECASMHGLYETIRKARLEPDVFIGHVAFGNLGLLHVPFPDIPKIGFFELFYDPYGRHSDNRPEYPAPFPNRMRVPLRNATQLIELEYCTKGYSPTPFQKSTYPAAYQDKLSVLFDGIDTQLYSPGEVTSQSELKRTWPADARIVTYVSRGLEAMRGFDIFMEVAHRVSQVRDDVHFVIAGNPQTHYGSEMITIREKGFETFKDYVLSKHQYDLSRFHFLNWISEPALVDLYRLSACHFYWTVPFTLSWSLFQALSTGCLVMGSDSAPVRDAITHEESGLLMAPYDIDDMVEQMLDVLDSPAKYQHLRDAAREQTARQYGFNTCLPKLAEFYLSATLDFDSAPTQPASIREPVLS